MSEKFYSPDEVAKMVLNKVLDTYKNSKLAKSNTSHEIEAGQEPTAPDAEAPEQLTGKNLKGMKQSKQAGGKKAEGEHEDAEQDLEQNLDVMDEHNEEMHDEPESEDSAYEYEEESEESDEDEEEDKKLPFTKSEKGIDLIKNFLGKREELAKSTHGKPGIHRPLHSRGINEVVSVSNDKEAEEKSLMGTRIRRGDKAGAKTAIKEIISEQKSMKKPNLPKSECESEPSLQKEGMKKGDSDPNVKEYTHKMPASHGKNKPTGHEKGVHHTIDSKGRPLSTSAGRSNAGSDVRSAVAAKQGKMFYGSTNNKAPAKDSEKFTERAKERHRKVIEEQKSMKKPNLPKSESME
jgi:hypothetical protein